MIVPGSASPLLTTTDGGYTIAKSLRFRASAGAYLNKTFSTNGTSQTKNSFSFWVKRGSIGVTSLLFEGYDGTSTNGGYIRFDSSDVLSYGFGGSSANVVSTTQVFRDPSAWYHIVIAVDTTQATAANRIKFYVNGSQITAFGTANYPAQNTTVQIFNSGYQSRIGKSNFGGGDNFDGYLSDVNFIDGQQLTPSSFGETDSITGVWKPKAYSGTYGTNGFYLKFTDVATTSGSNAGLGKDFSGNGNYWTTNNISVTSGATYDSMKDVPTLTDTDTANYCVLNPLNKASTVTITDGNLSASIPNDTGGLGTIGVTSGKWYFEVIASPSPASSLIGVANSTYNNGNPTSTTNTWFYYGGNGNAYNGATNSAYGATYSTSDVIGVAFDMDSGKIWYSKNGTFQNSGNPASGTNPAYSNLSGTIFPAMMGGGGNTNTNIYNFGQRPFTYTPPTGYKALNTYNLE